MTLPIRGVGVVVLLSTLLTVSAVSAQPATQYFAEGLARLQAGEAAAASFPLEAARTADPALRDTYPALVVAHLQAGEPQRAEVVAAQGLERFPGDLHLTQLRAEASLQQGEVEAALPLYRVVHEAMEAGRSVPNVTAAQVRERLATVLQHAGGRAYEQGRRADAVAHYREARSLAPADEDIHANLAALHLEAEAWGDALDVAEAGLRHAPRSTRLLRSQAAALGRLGEPDPIVQGAGRTDAGVHALAQVAHSDLTRPWTGFRLAEALNAHLRQAGAPIAILDCEPCDGEFHARFSATQRSYLYRIIDHRAPLAVDAGRAWNVKTPLDVDAMNDAAARLVGEHDFTTFRSTECQAKSPVKTLGTLVATRVQRHGRCEVEVTTTARSYLHNQVRSLAGCLRLVGCGKWTPDDAAASLAAMDRTACAPVAPAHGLYLTSVTY